MAALLLQLLLVTLHLHIVLLLLHVVKLLNLLREHLSDHQDLLRETIVFLDQDLLVLLILIFLLLDALSSLPNVALQVSPRLVRLVKLKLDLVFFLLNVLVELQLLVQSPQSCFQVVDVHPLLELVYLRITRDSAFS